jgi:hypothetical protein
VGESGLGPWQNQEIQNPVQGSHPLLTSPKGAPQKVQAPRRERQAAAITLEFTKHNTPTPVQARKPAARNTGTLPQRWMTIDL